MVSGVEVVVYEGNLVSAGFELFSVQGLVVGFVDSFGVLDFEFAHVVMNLVFCVGLFLQGLVTDFEVVGYVVNLVSAGFEPSLQGLVVGFEVELFRLAYVGLVFVVSFVVGLEFSLAVMYLVFARLVLFLVQGVVSVSFEVVVYAVMNFAHGFVVERCTTWSLCVRLLARLGLPIVSVLVGKV